MSKRYHEASSQISGRKEHQITECLADDWPVISILISQLNFQSWNHRKRPSQCSNSSSSPPISPPMHGSITPRSASPKLCHKTPVSPKSLVANAPLTISGAQSLSAPSISGMFPSSIVATTVHCAPRATVQATTVHGAPRATVQATRSLYDKPVTNSRVLQCASAAGVRIRT